MSDAVEPGAPGKEPVAPSSTDEAVGVVGAVTAEEEPTSLGWLERIRLMGWARLLLLALGLAALVLGGMNAWRSEASTALLVVGGLLAVFALVFAPDWREISLSYGDTRARILRGVDQALEQAEQSSPSEAVRQQIAEIRAKLDESAEKEAARERRSRESARSVASALQTLPRSAFLANPRASHTFIGTTSVMLSLQVPSRDGRSAYTCVVATPSGDRLTKTLDPPQIVIASGLAPSTYSAWFPDQFVGSGPLEPGSYKVEWRAGRVADRLAKLSKEKSALLAELLTLNTMALVAEDAFTIPEPPSAAEAGES